MVDQYSARLKLVIFLTRLRVGERGTPRVEVGNLLQRFIAEDQGALAGHLMSLFEQGQGRVIRKGPPHVAFFRADAAAQPDSQIAAIVPRTEPVAPSVELSLSSELERLFSAADSFREQTRPDEISPLHLLAAALNDESCRCTRRLRESGISQDSVLEQARNDAHIQ